MPPISWTQLTELSEEQLRVQVVLPMLAATPGIHGVNDVHGKNEKGLDIIFSERANIRTTCYGLQLKRGNISGGGTGGGTVKQIVDQLHLAHDLEHPVAIGGQGKVQMDRFIVATSGKISETARDEIASRLGTIPVDYWDGTEILGRIKRFIPELLTTADGTLVAYLKALIGKFDVLDTLDRIPGVAHRTLTQIYEEPTLKRRFDPSFAGGAGVESPSITIPALRVADLHQNAVIIGDQDAGKTALMRMLCLQRSRRVLGGQGDSVGEVPVLLNVRDLKQTGFDIAATILMEFKRREVVQLGADIQADLGHGRFQLFIDGFSELLATTDQEACHSAVEEIAKRYPRLHLIVAGRPADFLTPKYFQGFRHYVIQEFSSRQVASLLNRWTSDSPALADVAKRLVRRIHEALQLPGSPISATIGVMLYEHEHRYITNIAEAVDRYMVIRLGRYAAELGLTQQIEWSRKQDLLAEVAFASIGNEVNTISAEEIVSAFDAAFDRLGEERQGSVTLMELLDSGVLEVEEGFVSFPRNAFRDFFAAHAINQLDDRDDFIRKHLFDRRWGLALVFAAGLKRKNAGLLRGLVSDVRTERGRAIDEHKSDDYFYAAYLVGRILSNSELADREARLEVLRVSLTACSDSLPEFVATARKQFGNIGEIAALMSMEHTFMATVGVPWLQNQFRSLAEDTTLSDEERYIVASTYAGLGCDNCIELLEKVLADTSTTRVLLVLNVLVKQLRAERNLSESHRADLKSLEGRIHRKLHRPGRKAEVKSLMRMKSKAIELEIRRMRRLTAAKKS